MNVGGLFMDLGAIILITLIFAFALYGLYSFIRNMRICTLYSDLKKYMENKHD